MSEGLWWWQGGEDAASGSDRQSRSLRQPTGQPTDDPGIYYIPDPPAEDPKPQPHERPTPETTPAVERQGEPVPAPPAPRPQPPTLPPAVPSVPTATEQWEIPKNAAQWGQPTAPEGEVMGRRNAPGLTPVEMASFTVRRTGRDAFDNVAATLRELVAQEATRWIQAARQEATWH